MRALATALLLVTLAPATAAAGTFHVYGLGLNGAGCPSGWQAETWSASKFTQAAGCSTWQIESTRDGRSLANGDFAGASMYAPPGTRFTGFSMRSSGTTRNGAIWKIAMCQTAYASCQAFWPLSGSWNDTESALGSLAYGGAPLYAQHLWAGAQCGASSCADSADAGRAVDVTQMQSHAVVDDYSPPAAPSLSGVSTGWNSGRRDLSYTASDTGSGIESVTLTIDGGLSRTNVHACARLPAGGYSHPAPCLTRTGSSFVVNEPGQLADGRHSLTVTARDAGGGAASTSQEFGVDNNAPVAPIGLGVADGDAWRAANDFTLTWANPDQGAGAPIAGTSYRIGSGSESVSSATGSLEHLRVPGDGEWNVSVWLRDDAGNTDPAHAATATLRLDSTPPGVEFSQRSADDPATVRAAVSDASSGVTAGQIEIRRVDTTEWRALETRLDSGELAATVPDDRLERGTYELRATARDAAGNTATAIRQVELPLRADTTLTAKLMRTRDVAPYGERVVLRGVLRSGTGPLPRTRLGIYTRARGRHSWHALREVVTDGDGRYAVRLSRGPSRTVAVRFAGTRMLRPSTGRARVRVRGRASLALRPRRLRRGGTITFRGRVRHRGARIPAAGKLIQIQYLDGRRWRPAVKLGHTGSRGRFAIRYRFRRISRPTRIYFRILVPAEGGWPYATGWSPVRTAYVRP